MQLDELNLILAIEVNRDLGLPLDHVSDECDDDALDRADPNFTAYSVQLKRQALRRYLASPHGRKRFPK